MDIKELLDLTVKNKASDLHLLPNISPILRIDGELAFVSSMAVLTKGEIEQMIFSVMSKDQRELFLANKEYDFSISYGDEVSDNSGRFRVNVYFQKGVISAAFRYLSKNIKTIEELNLPKICHSFSKLKQGLILVAGPTGQGKSTTLASIVNEINLTRSVHILTIEDPLEYVYPKGKSIISQREMQTDTNSWNLALKSALREDPDVVLIGEMRDADTMAAAMTIAETGHLVFSTLHTNSASQTIDRIIDSFPDHQQSQIRTQLSFVLRGIISQRLITQITGGRIPAVEILIGSSAIANNIRDGKTHLIDSIIQTSSDVGMISLEASLSKLVTNGNIGLEIAREYSLHPDELLRLLS